MTMFPLWFHLLSQAALVLGFGCAAIVLADVVRHPQKMAVMNVVWPVCAAFASVLVLWPYFKYGRVKAKGVRRSQQKTPFPIMVAKGTLHCGSGCAIGDVFAEGLAFAAPGVAIWFGWKHIFDEKTFAVWTLDFVCAFAIGIAFQYFAIAPMRNLSPARGIAQAIKADSLSLAAWQVGMYGFMALAQFVLFAHAFGARARVDGPEFWFAMQIAMLCGFVTSYPVNWWLLRRGIKERM